MRRAATTSLALLCLAAAGGGAYVAVDVLRDGDRPAAEDAPPSPVADREETRAPERGTLEGRASEAAPDATTAARPRPGAVAPAPPSANDEAWIDWALKCLAD